MEALPVQHLSQGATLTQGPHYSLCPHQWARDNGTHAIKSHDPQAHGQSTASRKPLALALLLIAYDLQPP